MSRHYLIAGNWKMNTTTSEAIQLATDVAQHSTTHPSVKRVLCPPAIHINAVVESVKHTDIGIGAQNCHPEAKGAFTGEISVPMLRASGCTYCIIGHSERRTYFGETDEFINKKVRSLLIGNIQPILCIGETLEQRQAGTTMEVVRQQLEGCFQDITPEEAANVVIAYEPVWAIGTGLAATSEQAQEVHAFIRSWVISRFGNTGSDMYILYGGSMNEQNAAELLAQPDIDGGLIGGAALKPASFAAIIAAAQQHA